MQPRSHFDELAELFGKHVDVPIPGSSPDDSIERARFALIAYDSHVAGVATRVLSGVEVPAEWLTPDGSLDERLERLAAGASASDAPLVDEYRRYKQALDTLLSLAGQVVDEGGRPGRRDVE